MGLPEAFEGGTLGGRSHAVRQGGMKGKSDQGNAGFIVHDDGRLECPGSGGEWSVMAGFHPSYGVQ